jgi:hypothetical protein
LISVIPATFVIRTYSVFAMPWFALVTTTSHSLVRHLRMTPLLAV